MPYIITNLVFQGGSVKGAAYVGALKALKQKMDFNSIRCVAGTSAGAIIATILALGFEVGQIEQLLRDFDFKDVLDETLCSIPTQGKILKSVEKLAQGQSFFLSKIPAKAVLPVLINRSKNQHGIYDGEYIRLWVDKLIKEQVTLLTKGKHTGELLTFKELHQLTIDYPGKFRDLGMIGSNFTTGKKIRFHFDNPEMENLIISDALRISMSIPQLFKPHHLYFKVNGERQIDVNQDLCVDGGLYENYPINFFDAPQYTEDAKLLFSEDGRRLYNPHTLGFRLVSKECKDYFEGRGEVPRRRLNNIFDYGNAIVGVRSDLQEESCAFPENVSRTIFIDSKNICSLAFNLTNIERESLVLSGQEATENFLRKNTVISLNANPQ